MRQPVGDIRQWEDDRVELYPQPAQGEGVYNVNEWKQTIEVNFRQWLDQLEGGAELRADAPDAFPSAADEDQTPDLYAFFEALCVLRSDVSKSSRRSHETFARFGETLAGFEKFVHELSARLTAERQERGRLESAAQKRFLLPYAEMLERLNRLAEKLARPPQASLFSARRRWSVAWASFEQGFGLLRDHFQLLLQDAGIAVMETTGQPFDPTRMKAVAVEESATLPPNTVIEELGAGYWFKDEVLKFAEVKVAGHKGGDA
jgi:molecular chaperone GrpE (heat shock protein)